MLVIQTFRADRLLAMASVFVATVMGETFQHYADHEIDLSAIVSKEVGGHGVSLKSCDQYVFCLRLLHKFCVFEN